MNKTVVTVLGALTGAVGLVAMARLVTSAFPGAVSPLAWAFVLSAMVPWVVYAAWRARHGRLSARAGLVVAGLNAVAVVSVWLFTVGPVIALVGSLAAFVIIWVHDWPDRRADREAGGGGAGEESGGSRFVRFEELVADRGD